MDLAEWRTRINDLDNQILHLLNQRAEAALQIGDLKRRQDAPTYVPEREVEIVRRLTAANGGPMSSETVEAVWREILSGCRALEGSLAVAYLGPPATFTPPGALHASARGRTCGPCARSSRSSRKSSASGRRLRVVPVENSTRAPSTSPSIGSRLRGAHLRRALSRDRAAPASRARDWVRSSVCCHIPRASRSAAAGSPSICRGGHGETPSTAAAAEMAASDVTVAAIASDLAGRLYGVPV